MHIGPDRKESCASSQQEVLAAQEERVHGASLPLWQTSCEVAGISSGITHKLGFYVDANALQVSDEIDGPAMQRTRCLALDDLATAQHTSFLCNMPIICLIVSAHLLFVVLSDQLRSRPARQCAMIDAVDRSISGLSSWRKLTFKRLSADVGTALQDHSCHAEPPSLLTFGFSSFFFFKKKPLKKKTFLDFYNHILFRIIWLLYASFHCDGDSRVFRRDYPSR